MALNDDPAPLFSGVSGNANSSLPCDALFVQKKKPEIFEVFLIGTGEGAVPTVKLHALPVHSLTCASPMLRERCLGGSGRFLISQVELADRLRNGRALTPAQKVAIGDAISVSAWDSFICHTRNASELHRQNITSVSSDCQQACLHERIDTVQHHLVNLSIFDDKSTHACLVGQVESILAAVQKCTSDSCSFSDEAVAIKTQLRVVLSSYGSGLLTHGVAVIGHLRQLVEVHISKSMKYNMDECIDILRLLLLAVALRVDHLVSTCLNTIAQRWPEVVLCPSKARVSVPNAGAMLSLLPPAMQEQLGHLLGTTPMGRALLQEQHHEDHRQVSHAGHMQQFDAFPDGVTSNEEKQTVNEVAKAEGQLCGFCQPFAHAKEHTSDANAKCEENMSARTKCAGQFGTQDVPKEDAEAATRSLATLHNASHNVLRLLKQCSSPEKVDPNQASALSRQNLFEQRARQLQQQLQKLPVPTTGNVTGSVGTVVASTCDHHWTEVQHPSSGEGPAQSFVESKLRQPAKRIFNKQIHHPQLSGGSNTFDSPPPLQAKLSQSSIEKEGITLSSEAEAQPKSNTPRGSNGSNKNEAVGVHQERNVSREKSIARKFLSGPVQRKLVSSIDAQKQLANCSRVVDSRGREVGEQDSLCKSAAQNHSSAGHAQAQTKSQSQTSKAAALAAMWLAHDSCTLPEPENNDRSLDKSASGSDFPNPKAQDHAVAVRTCNRDSEVSNGNTNLDCPKDVASGSDAGSAVGYAGALHSQWESEESAHRPPGPEDGAGVPKKMQRSDSVEALAVRRAQRRLAERRKQMEQSAASRLSESEARRAEQFRKRDARIQNFMRRQEESALRDDCKQTGCSQSSREIDSVTDIPKSTPSPGCGGSRSFSDMVHSTLSECKTPGDSTVLPETGTPSPPSRIASRIARLLVASDTEEDDVCQPRSIPPQPYPM